MDENKQRIKLVHITTVPESLFFLAGQVSYARSKGFEVHAISSHGEMLDQFKEQEGATVHAVEMPRRITPLCDLRAVFSICRILRKVRPSIVHAHTPKGGLLGTIAARLAGVPVRIYHIHGLPLMTATGWKRLLLETCEKVSCRMATQVLCVSGSIRQVAVDLRLCPPGKIKVLLGGSINGVDAAYRFNPEKVGKKAGEDVRAMYSIPDSAIVLGFIGRIVRDKGLVELTEAWRVLSDQYPDLHMIVVGPFEPQDPVPPDVEQALRSDPRIHLTGRDWDTPRLYSAMDIVVLPTYREGLPGVPLEAGAMELPVVATQAPGCVDAVRDTVTGILVPLKDSAALAGAIRAYIDDPELRRRHGLAGREHVLRDFRPESIWEAACDEYARLLGLPGGDLRIATLKRKSSPR